ncbi:MAG: DUF1565 domain-containing protein, partial [Anaerolineae bacterium]|nr:DUF1565 domain-containing protein [Anaerolineae bacterium]
MKNSVIHYCLLVVAILIALGLNTGASQSATLAPQNSDYYVDAVNGDDVTGDGSLINPWRTITWALSQASGPGDTLHAQPGVYDTTLGESFPIQLSGGVSLIGADRDTTTISGVAGSAVVQISNSSTDILSDTVLSDITLQNGGYGLYISASYRRTIGPTISNVRACYNTHGVYIRSSGDWDYTPKYTTANPSLTRVLAYDNTQTGFLIKAFHEYSISSPVIYLSVSYGNGTYGMQIDGQGQGGYAGTASPIISDTLIAYNGSHGIYLTASYEGRSNPRLDRSLIEHNDGWGVYWTPGLSSAHVNAKLYDDIIVNNQQGGLRWGSGGPAGTGGSFRLVNNTIASNTAYGIHWSNNSTGVTPMVINTILWNENADDLYATSSPGWTTAHVQYSDIEDGDFAGAWGNFSADPLFVETADGPFHLGSGSPAIDKGDTTLSDLSSLDWDWDPRVVNGVVDVGADEVAPSLLASTKLAPATAAPGQIITYTIIARNDGALGITGTRLTDTLPTPATYVPGSLSASAGDAGAASGVITWTGALSAGTPVTLTFAVTTSSTLPDSLLTNTAVITHPLLNAPHMLTAARPLSKPDLEHTPTQRS